MLSFEVKPAPGVGVGESLWLTNRDFNLKEIERSSIQDAVQYQLTFDKPIAYGKAITMYLKLSLDENLQGALARYTFATKTVSDLPVWAVVLSYTLLRQRVACIPLNNRSIVEVGLNRFFSTSATNWGRFLWRR